MDMSARASWPSSLASHCAWLPRPGGTLRATTSKMPPTESPARARRGPSPIGPVAILDAHRPRRADGLSRAPPGKRVNVILLNFLAPAASVTELAAVQFMINEVDINAQACRQA